MENKIEKSNVNQLFASEGVRKRFEELLGKRAPAFITSVLQAVNSNDLLRNADPMTILNASATSASMNLPINQNLGYAYIVPYNVKQSDGSYKTMAQFQMGYKGFIQLAQRSGQFLRIASAPVYEGQLKDVDPLQGYTFDWNARKSDKLVGYVAYFKLINGFESTLFMSTAELEAHGKKYSQTFKKGYGLWATDFDAMASKTVLKLLLGKYAPLSIDMQRAVIADQGIINDADSVDVTYVDNEVVEVKKDEERIRLLVNDCNTPDELATLKETLKNSEVEFTAEMNELFMTKLKSMTNENGKKSKN
jgi:recombination protein RecT